MKDDFPPKGYVAVDSQLEGFVIYAPAPEEEQKQKIVDFNCPQCYAITAYSLEDKGLKCSSCGYFEPVKREVIGRQVEEFEFKTETVEQSAHGWGEARRQLECQKCAAITILADGELKLTCSFCGSSQLVQSDALQDSLRPRSLIPFTVNDDKCVKITKEWLGSSWMTPSKLRQVAQVGAFNGIYLPFWTFDAQTTARWQAQVGYNKTEYYYSGGERKSRTVTKWRSESGQVGRVFDDLIISGTKHLSKGVLGQIRSFNLDELVPFDPKYLAGWQAQAYVHTLEQAWETGREEMRDILRKSCKSDALEGDADKVRNMRVSIDFGNERWRYLLLPVYLAPYNYNGEDYQIAVNGQSGTIGGSRPVDWFKVIGASAALFIPSVFLGLIGLLFFPLLIVALIAFVAAIGIGFAFISKAMKISNPDQKSIIPEGIEGLL